MQYKGSFLAGFAAAVLLGLSSTAYTTSAIAQSKTRTNCTFYTIDPTTWRTKCDDEQEFWKRSLFNSGGDSAGSSASSAAAGSSGGSSGGDGGGSSGGSGSGSSGGSSGDSGSSGGSGSPGSVGPGSPGADPGRG